MTEEGKSGLFNVDQRGKLYSFGIAWRKYGPFSPQESYNHDRNTNVITVSEDYRRIEEYGHKLLGGRHRSTMLDVTYMWPLVINGCKGLDFEFLLNTDKGGKIIDDEESLLWELIKTGRILSFFERMSFREGRDKLLILGEVPR